MIDLSFKGIIIYCMRSIFEKKNPAKIVQSGKKKKLSLASAVIAIVFYKRLKKRQKKSKHRGYILDEWLQTQYSYCRGLEITSNLIKNPMLNQYKIISDVQVPELFPQLEGMIALSKYMQSVIENAKAQKNPNHILIGKKLNSFAEGFKLYRTYFTLHGKKQKILQELTQFHEKQMKQIQANLQKEMKKIDASKEAITIKDCMEQPLYRLFKYVLLMKDYIKKLPTTHPDYEAVNCAMKTFHDINTANNQRMKECQEQEKTQKLNTLYGGVIKNTRTFVAEMQADTIYSTGKLYLFNDLVIVTKLQSTLGSEREEKLQTLELDEFSYINEQKDMKYFKNILVLIGAEQCIHLLFADQGSRFQVYKSLNKVLRELRVKSDDRRRVDSLQRNRNENKKKITFTLNTNKPEDLCFRPEFRVQIIGFEVRPISTMTNDTVYVTRFMLPVYYDDELLELETRSEKQGGKKQFKVRKLNSLPFSSENKYDEDEEFEEAGLKRHPHSCINQRIQVHFSQLQNIYNTMVPKCQDKLPNIDPITKEVNLYSKGKKKTKSFEMRKFFIEEFFNYVFRFENLLENPLWFIEKLRINPHLWEYATERNKCIRYPASEKKSFGRNHCRTCEKAWVNSIEEFEHYRFYFLGSGKHLQNRSPEKYCFNFFNLARTRLLTKFSTVCFTTLERILLYYHYSQGRLDYPFLPHLGASTSRKILHVYLTVPDEEVATVQFTENSTVGEIIDEIGMKYGMKICFDYELLAIFNGQRRILDRDEFIVDTIATLNLKCVQVGENDQQTGSSLIGTIKKWGHDVFSKEDSDPNRIYFYKTIYLYKSLQLQSYDNKKIEGAQISKKQLQLRKIYWSIRQGLIKLSDAQFVELAAIYYCLEERQKLSNFSTNKLNKKIIYQILPKDKTYSFENYAEMKRQIGLMIEREKEGVIKSSKGIDLLLNRVLDIAWNNKDYYTYYVYSEVRTIPASVCKVPPNYCLIGVNYKNIVITKSQNDTSAIVNLGILDVEFFTSVFSIFITHQELGDFRFDSKMVHHFGQIVKKYQSIARRFPQVRA